MKEGDPWVGVSLGEGVVVMQHESRPDVEEAKEMTKKLLESGALVSITKVIKGGPAEQAGLTAGQLVLAVDGQKVSTVAGTVKLIRSHKVGDVVVLEVKEALGAGEAKKVSVTIGAFSPKMVEEAE
jgi:S1-C subfamily serine protease